MSKRKYIFNQQYFDSIDTPNKAYILGFIGADGNNNREGFRVELHNKDLDILYKIQKEIGDCKLTSTGNRCGLWYYSMSLSRKLTELGVMPNKTHFFDFIETKFDRDFIRGYFDGDGSIFIDKNNYNRANITFTGNDLLIVKIKFILDKKFKLEGYTYCRHHRSPNIITLSYCGTNSCSKILDWLYKDAEIYLDRKYDLYKQVMEVKNFHNNKKQLRENRENKKKLKKKNKEEEDRIIEKKVLSLLDNNYSIRQIKLQYGIDQRRVRKIIDKEGYNYPTRRRMFAVQPD